MTNSIPVLYGFRETTQKGRRSVTQVRVYCPACKREHFHGSETKTGNHVVAHCGKGPYENSGYLVVVLDSGFWTAELWAALMKEAKNIRRLNRYFKPKRKKL